MNRCSVCTECIVDEAKIPLDIVKALFNRASKPLSYEVGNRSKLLFIACAVIRKYHNDISGKEEWTMSLDENQKRPQLSIWAFACGYGKKIERDTYDKDEMREPNAIRMQADFL